MLLTVSGCCRKLIPNPKSGTVVSNLKAAIKEAAMSERESQRAREKEVERERGMS